MSNPTDGYNPTREQQQNMDNLSFDRKYLVNSVENLVEDEAGTKVERMVQPMKESTAKDGSQKTQITTSLINFVFDSVYLNEPDTVTEVYTYKLSGDTVATITIIYTDDSKETLISCIRT